MSFSLPQRILDDKRKLIVLLSVLLSIGFIVTSLASYFVSKGSIRESIVVSELPLTSDNIYSEIQKDLVQPVFISSMMASDTFLRDWVLDNELDTLRVSKYLKEVQQKYGAVTAFFVSEKSRTYYYENGALKTVSDTDPVDKWYFRVRQIREPYEINFDPDEAHHNALTFFINYRMTDYEGNFIGVAGIGLTVDTVRKLIEDYQQRYQRKIYFVDPQGNIVLFGEHTDDAGNNIRTIPGLQTEAERILNQRGGSFQYQRNGHTHLLNVRFIPELKWFLFVEKTEDDALFDIRKTLVLNLLICVFITAGVLVATNIVINRYQRRLEVMATTDRLTGLANRQTFEAIADHAVRESKRTGEPLSAMLIDIDHFKAINDRYGHFGGDAAIRGVAQTTRESLRDVDLVCRWGGEEYLVLLKRCSIANAETLAEKIRAAIKDSRYHYNEVDIAVTVSLGIAKFNGGESVEQLLSRADKALYDAKHMGRDRVVIA